jgi:sialate O-acetylesterase
VWGNPDLAFHFMQLAPFRYGGDPTKLAGIWEAQTATLAVPHTGMAVTVDISNVADIHPKNKQDVGKRLALAALAKTYGKTIVYSGPMYKSMEKKGNQIVLQFDHVGGGLVAKGDKLQGFAVAGADKKFVWADAKIVGNTVVVSSPSVAEPVAVRYAWADNPICNFYNQEGLPACPFRTDDWPGITANTVK